MAKPVDRSAAPRCTDPRKGALLADYVHERLAAPARNSFEEHYFECPACLAELQLRSALENALEAERTPTRDRASTRPKHRGMGWASAAAIGFLVIAGGAWLALSTSNRRGSVEPFELTIESTLRSASAPARAPGGRPVRLVLLGDFSARADVSYALRVERDDGTSVAVDPAPARSAPNRLEWLLPRGFDRSGAYQAVLEEQFAGRPPTTRRFPFEVGPG